MEAQRLQELAGISSKYKQIDELHGVDVVYNKDTIRTLRKKLKAAGVAVNNMSDDLILKFANAMKEITIEDIKTSGDMIKEVESE